MATLQWLCGDTNISGDLCKKTAGHTLVNALIVSLASPEFENENGVNECANTDNMSDVHCKFKRFGARLTYGVRTLGVQV